MQARFEVGVGEVDWYCSEEHVVSELHTLSALMVGAVAWYCAAEHWVTPTQLPVVPLLNVLPALHGLHTG